MTATESTPRGTTSGTGDATSLRVSQRIRATPARLFDAWTDPKLLARWWRMDGPGWAFAGATVDLRVGGRYRLSMTAPDGKAHVASGEYQDVRPGQRLAFTWEWENPESRVGNTLVTVEFNVIDKDTTDVVLTHERFAEAARVAGHTSGWTQLLRLLDRATQEGTHMPQMTTRETIERYFERLQQKSGWEAQLADDMVFTSHTMPNKHVEGKAAYLEATKRFYGSIVRFEVRDLIVDGERACAFTHYDLKGPGGTPAFQSDVAEVFSVLDGRIASLGIYFDSAPFPK